MAQEEPDGAEMVEDVVRLMDHIGIESAHVVGYSMGAAIGVKLLEMAPGRIWSLGLDHVSAIIDPALSRGIREFLSREAGR